jgi:hypothetical protein
VAFSSSLLASVLAKAPALAAAIAPKASPAPAPLPPSAAAILAQHRAAEEERTRLFGPPDASGTRHKLDPLANDAAWMAARASAQERPDYMIHTNPDGTKWQGNRDGTLRSGRTWDAKGNCLTMCPTPAAPPPPPPPPPPAPPRAAAPLPAIASAILTKFNIPTTSPAKASPAIAAPIVAALAPKPKETAPMEGFDLGGILQAGASVAGKLIDMKVQKDANKTALQISQSQPVQFVSSQQPIPDFGPINGGGFGMIPTVGRPMITPLGRSAAPGNAVSGAIVGAGRAVGRGVMIAGRWVTSKQGVALAKSIGFQAAVTALGISAFELADWLMADATKKKRARGVSGAALKTTRRTMRTVERMHRQIAGYCRDAGVRTTRFVRAPAPSFGKKCK